MPFDAFPTSIPPVDAELVDKIVSKLKTQGIFDQFRKDCLADVDTKPAYQNLQQRVNGTVATFLATQQWQPDLNKTQLRESLRRHVQQGFLEVGVDRIVDQVVNPKIVPLFMPRVEDVVCDCLGIDKPKIPLSVTLSTQFLHSFPPPLPRVNPRTLPKVSGDLLPKGLDPVSPESDHCMNRGGDTPLKDERPSPVMKTEEDGQSQLSGISDLSSHVGDSSYRENPLDSNTIKSITSPKPQLDSIHFDNFSNLTEKIKQAEITHGQVGNLQSDDMSVSEELTGSSTKEIKEETTSEEVKFEVTSNNSISTFEDSKTFVTNKLKDDTFSRTLSEEDSVSSNFVVKGKIENSSKQFDSDGSNMVIETQDNSLPQEPIDTFNEFTKQKDDTFNDQLQISEEPKMVKKEDDKQKEKKSRDSSSSSKYSRNNDRPRHSDVKYRSSHEKKDDKSRDRSNDKDKDKDKDRSNKEDNGDRSVKDDKHRSSQKDDKYKSQRSETSSYKSEKDPSTKDVRDKYKREERDKGSNKDKEKPSSKDESYRSSQKDDKNKLKDNKHYSSKDKSRDKNKDDSGKKIDIKCDSKDVNEKDRKVDGEREELSSKSKPRDDSKEKDHNSRGKLDSDKLDRDDKDKAERDNKMSGDKEIDKHYKDKYRPDRDRKHDKESGNGEKSKSSKRRESKSHDRSNQPSSSAKKPELKTDDHERKSKIDESRNNIDKNKTEEEKKDRKRKGERCKDEVKGKDPRRSSDRDSSGSKGGSSNRINSESKSSSSQSSKPSSCEKKSRGSTSNPSSKQGQNDSSDPINSSMSQPKGSSEHSHKELTDLDTIMSRLNSSINEDIENATSNQDLKIEETLLKKPKIAKNISEIRKVMQARKNIDRKFKGQKDINEINTSANEETQSCNAIESEIPEENKENIKNSEFEKLKTLKSSNNKNNNNNICFVGFSQPEVEKSINNFLIYEHNVVVGFKRAIITENLIDHYKQVVASQEFVDNNLNKLKSKLSTFSERIDEENMLLESVVNGKNRCYVLLTHDCPEIVKHLKNLPSTEESSESVEKLDFEILEKTRRVEENAEGSRDVGASEMGPTLHSSQPLHYTKRQDPINAQGHQPAYTEGSNLKTFLPASSMECSPTSPEGDEDKGLSIALTEDMLNNLMKESMMMEIGGEMEDSDGDGAAETKEIVFNEHNVLNRRDELGNSLGDPRVIFPLVKVKEEDKIEIDIQAVEPPSVSLKQEIQAVEPPIISLKQEIQAVEPPIVSLKQEFQAVELPSVSLKQEIQAVELPKPGAEVEREDRKRAAPRRASRSSQSYSSDDLYKPRPAFPHNTRRINTIYNTGGEEERSAGRKPSVTDSKRRKKTR